LGYEVKEVRVVVVVVVVVVVERVYILVFIGICSRSRCIFEIYNKGRIDLAK